MAQPALGLAAGPPGTVGCAGCSCLALGGTGGCCQAVGLEEAEKFIGEDSCAGLWGVLEGKGEAGAPVGCVVTLHLLPQGT